MSESEPQAKARFARGTSAGETRRPSDSVSLRCPAGKPNSSSNSSAATRKDATS